MKTNRELIEMAQALYTKMGGLMNQDARVVRALAERLQEADDEIALRKTRRENAQGKISRANVLLTEALEDL